MPISKRLEVRHRQPLALDFRIHLVAIQITPPCPFPWVQSSFNGNNFPSHLKTWISFSVAQYLCQLARRFVLDSLWQLWKVQRVSIQRFLWKACYENIEISFSTCQENILTFLPIYQCKGHWRRSFFYSRDIKDMDDTGGCLFSMLKKFGPRLWKYHFAIYKNIKPG